MENLKCNKCQHLFLLEDAEISFEVIDFRGSNKIDISVNCPDCEEMAFFALVDQNDLLTPTL